MKTPIEMALDGVEWVAAPVPEVRMVIGKEGPYATHQGVWDFQGERLKVYRLNNGETVIDADDFERVFGEMLVALGEIK